MGPCINQSSLSKSLSTDSQTEKVVQGAQSAVNSIEYDSQPIFWKRLWPRVVLVVVSIVAAISIAKSLNWPFVHDAPLMHYIVFLMSNGFSPYRDIFDMNMPGTYVIHWLVFHTLGGSAIAWRSFDLLLSVIATFAALYITRPYDRYAGWIVGGILVIGHLSVGPIDLGQRDYIMAVLLLTAYAFLFAAIRRLRPSMLFFSAVLFTWATLIKPTSLLLTVLMLALGVYIARKRGQQTRKYVVSAVLGCGCTIGFFAAFLLKEHSLGAFFQIVFGLVPYHASMGNASWKGLLLNLHQANWALTVIVGLLLLRYCRCWENWEQWALLVGGLFGGLSYVIQRKGWHYHTYPEAFFLCIWIITLCLLALRTRSRVRYLALTLLLFNAFVIGPYFLVKEFLSGYSMTNLNSMRADLRTLGGQALNRNVQCFDWGRGCINALFQERIVQTTGAIYDFYLFPVRPDPVPAVYQQKFYKVVSMHPPKVLIVTDDSWPPGLGYSRIGNWPVFSEFLQKNYRLDRAPNLRANSVQGIGYRVYLRNGP